MRGRLLTGLGVAVAVVVLASGVVLAASKVIPNDGVFYACYDSGGNVKLIDYSVTQTCPKSWTGPVTWNQSGFIGVHNVYGIDNTFAEGGPGSIVLRVWMQTGSSSEACLVTMGEAFNGVAVDGVNCSSRNVTIAEDNTQWGVYVTLVLAAPLPDESWYSMNVYQEGAKEYGDPIPCLGLPGCNG